MIHLLLACALAGATEYPFVKRVTPYKLQTELVTAGFLVDHIDCWDDSCKIFMPNSELKNPQPIIDAHVYADPLQQQITRKSLLRAIYRRIVLGTDTAADRATALKLIIELLGSD